MTKKKPNIKQLFDAINARNLESFSQLMTAGIDANAAADFTTAANMTLLSRAAGCRFLEGVDLLLKLGANPNIAAGPGATGEGGGQTALHEVINGGYFGALGDEPDKALKIVDLLLKAGANPNAVRDKDTVPLVDSAHRGYFYICQRLIEAGGTVRDWPVGCTPPLLGAASGFGRAGGEKYEKIAKLLIEHGAPIDGESANGATALMVAAFRGSECLVNLFLDNGANPNRQAKSDGRTPLICAALYYKYDGVNEENEQIASRIIKRLLEAGADPAIRNRKGESAFEIASRGKSPKVAEYINNFVKKD